MVRDSKTPTFGVATVLTVYGIETFNVSGEGSCLFRLFVATVLTVYGIET